MTEFAMKEFPLDRAFQFLEPGPVVLVTTQDGEKANIMTVSWHMVMDFTPRIGCIIGPWDHSFTAMRATAECVIAVPTVDLAKTVVRIGNCSGTDTDKFATFGLTPVRSKRVKAPRIAECLANIECRVVDDSLVDAHNLFILEGVQAWVDAKRSERRTFHANGDGTFSVDGETLDLREEMTKWKSII
jgi:flavin reductase (DIM6/NTAB) family NADH-FMN oxidoreductase RutF